MTRLIDADELIEAMTKFSNATGEDMTHGIFYAHIAPTIDAMPVRHGKWISHGDCGVTECSCCGWNIEECVGWNYCPNCGARMDKE